MRVLVRSAWAPYGGTEYVEALGIYPDLASAREDAMDYAWNKWEAPEPDEDEEEGFEDEGPCVLVEEYIPGKEGHDNERAGGGSFEDDFARMEA